MAPSQQCGVSRGGEKAAYHDPFSAGAGFLSRVCLTSCASISSTEMGYRQTKGEAQEAEWVTRKSYLFP